MKYKLMAGLAAALLSVPVLAPAQHGREGGERGGGGRGFGGGEHGRQEGGARPGTQGGWGGGSMVRMRRVEVPRPERINDSRNVVNDSRRIEVPRNYGNGEAIRKEPSLIPPREHRSIAGNRSLVREMSEQRRAETAHGRFFWHTSGGVRFAHFVDDHDVHWYGFYHGPRFYWCRFYGDRWWWFDPAFSRWVFWWGGYWWWPGPGGAYFVYMDNNYYPYEGGGVTVKSTEPVAAPEKLPAPGEGKSWLSPDGKRLVQVFGDRKEAFLYDNSGGKPVFLAYLGRDAEKVRFSGGSDGQPLTILVDFKDGSFALFDREGKSGEPAPLQPGTTIQPPPGDTLPPPPPAAPGQ